MQAAMVVAHKIHKMLVIVFHLLAEEPWYDEERYHCLTPLQAEH